MENKSTSVAIIVSSLLFVTLIGIGGMFLPSWGKFELTPTKTVTKTPTVVVSRTATKTFTATRTPTRTPSPSRTP